MKSKSTKGKRCSDKKAAQAIFNFKSILGRWTARKDKGLRSKSGFSYVTPAYTAYMRLRGVAVQRTELAAVLVFYNVQPGAAAD